MSHQGRESAANGGEGCVEPPIVDLLYFEEHADAYIVVLVPSDAVSSQPTETIQVLRGSADGRQITAWLGEFSKVLGRAGIVVRVVHRGGSDFAIVFDDGASVALSDCSTDIARIYDGLQDISQSAQALLRIQHMAAHAASK